ncbi:hypothetical protein OIV83_003155 [Microbotryomycetes sp. JL201]|nr:hypothetical protein OIV83_003155 [Microbotryomycetes sp. JL201]
MSGKRAADKQLTDRDWDDEDKDDEPTQNGEFAQAAPAEIATRKIRGLPQRKGASSTAQAAAAPAAAKPLFGGFGSSPNPFAALSTPPAATNGASSATADVAKPNPFATVSFGATQPASANSATSMFSFVTTKDSSATNDAAKPPAPAFSFGTSTAPVPSKAQETPALKYYTALRGLNVSLVEALTAEVEKDPFVNLATTSSGLDKVKQKYVEHRQRIEAEYTQAGRKSEPTSTAAPIPATKSAEAEASAPAPPAPAAPSFAFTSSAPSQPATGFSFAASPSPPKASEPAMASKALKGDTQPKSDTKGSALAPPAPPSSFTFGGKPVTQASTPTEPSKPVSGGFVFNPSAPKDPYAEESKFKLPAAAPSAPAKASSSESSSGPKSSGLSATATKFQPAAPSPLRFGVSDSTAKGDDPSGNKPPAKFSFGASFGAFAKGDAGNKKQDDEASKKANGNVEAGSPATTSEAPKSAPQFGQPAAGATSGPSAPSAPAAEPTFSFGSSTSSTPSTAFSFGGPAATPTKPLGLKPQSSPPLATAFGSGSPPAFAFGAALGPKKDSPSAFKANPGFSFGVSTGASPSFGFGSSASSSTSAAAAPAAPAFAFGAVSNAATAGSALSSRAESLAGSDTAPSTVDGEAVSAADADAASSSSGLFGQGVGEEGETVLHQVKTKVVVLGKEGPQEKGIGILSIKEKTGDDGKTVRRVLTRNEGNNSVMMNFLIQPSMVPKLEKTFVTILGFDGSQPTMYRLRVKTKEMAEELHKQLLDAAKQA